MPDGAFVGSPTCRGKLVEVLAEEFFRKKGEDVLTNDGALKTA